MPTPIEDSETLLSNILPQARKTLEAHGSLDPLAATIDSDGNFHRLTEVQIESASAVQVLAAQKKCIADRAEAGSCRAAALCYATKVNLPDGNEVGDAIVVSLAHREGYAVDLCYPYRRNDGTVLWGEAFASESEADLFD